MTVLAPIRPTLYIGLGGTGKEVLLRQRRRVFDRFGIPSLPWTRFLHIDSDVGYIDNDLREVEFEARERVDLFDKETSEAIKNVLAKREEFSFIHDWLDRELEMCLFPDPEFSILHNAQGERAFGRLMFFLKFEQIESALKNALMELRLAQTSIQAHRFCEQHDLGDTALDPSNSPMVHVVSSLGGGTGAGILIDLTFLLRHLEAACASHAYIASYVFMPSVYHPDPKQSPLATRSFANAYATLMELNHFCIRYIGDGVEGPSADFEVKWQDKKPLRVMGPPVNVTHLFEMRNTNGMSLPPESRRELFSVLADYLFVDTTSDSFSSARRSHGADMEFSLARTSFTGSKALSQAFSQRFAAFGLSKLEVPVDTIRAACASQLGADVAGYILREVPNYDVESAAVADLSGVQLDVDGVVGAFGQGWREIADGAIEVFFKDQIDGRPVDGLRCVRELSQLRQQLFSFQNGDESKNGQVALFMQHQFEAVLADARHRADSLLRIKYLERADCGLAATLRPGGCLDACVQKLTDFIWIDTNRRCETGRSQCDFWDQLQHEICFELVEATDSTTVRVLGSSKWTQRILLDRLRNATIELFYNEAEFILCSLARHVLQAIRNHLDCFRRNSLHQLLDSAIVYAAECTRKTTELEHRAASSSTIFCRLYDKQADWKRFYSLDDKEHDGCHRGVESAKEYGLLMASLGLGGGLIELAEYLHEYGSKNLSDKIGKYCSDRFGRDFQSNDRNVDILEHPLFRSNREEYLRRLANAALPWVRQDMLDPTARSIQHRIVFLGVGNPNEAKARQLCGDLTRLSRSQTGLSCQIELLATGNINEIVLFVSDYGFPLPLLPIVTNEARNAYWDYYDRSNEAHIGMIPLHLSKKWEGQLEELVVHCDQDAAILREIASILLFGTMLKLLVLTERNGQVFYGYSLGPPFSRAEPIGPKRQAVARLLKDAYLRSKLSAALEEREAALTVDQMLAYLRGVLAVAESQDPMRNTQDNLLLTQKIEYLCSTGGVAVQQGFEIMRAMDPKLRFECFHQLDASGLEWILNTNPVVWGLSKWEFSR